MHCSKCGFKPDDKFIDDRLETLYVHFRERHPNALEDVISPVCLVAKDIEN